MLNKLNFALSTLFVHTACSLFIKYTPIVEVSEGKLRGIRALNGQNLYLGIPYGVSERFQPPKPPKKWGGVFDAIVAFGTCAQAISIFHLGSEDCLSLDIYTPKSNTNRRKKFPVLVFFHGGAYHYGGKWHYDPEFLVKKNVIVVIANYRVGVLGFLCLNNVANLGLKDQLEALKWIQRNIAAFSGDPDNVTICGQSAGATSASMHLLSKRSKGLFHKAILMSGVAFTPWAFNLDPVTPALEDAKKIRSVRNEADIYNTFLKAPIGDVLSASRGTSSDPKYFKYSPCGDANFTDPFFHDTPYNIIKSGDFNKVPIIAGFTNIEGMLFYSINNQRTLEYLDRTFPDRLPSIFSWCSEKDRLKIANKIRSHYFGKKRIASKASTKGGIDMFADWIAYAAIDAFSKLMAKYSDKPVYNYLFSYEGARNYAKFVFDHGYGLKGATHADDIFYVYKPIGLSIGLKELDKLMIEQFTTMLTNFMKFGDPTPTKSSLLPVRWPATTENRSQVMRIDHPLSVSDTPERFKGEFYRTMLCEYGQSGYVPCESAMQCNLDK